MKTFVSRSGTAPPPGETTTTEKLPVFDSTETDMPLPGETSATDVPVSGEACATEHPVAPEDNTATTEARPNASWTKRELIAYAERHGINYPADGCKSEIYAAVTGGLEESYGDTC